ncbi:MAG: alpha/beta hydrolase [Bacteroidaceae bacterium]|jgi:alpha/beta superfamily hydrolase|nr:alpha/beta hydrolase [Bacteroidaceae bacterium]MBP5219130.1 alpha/beta hydrolase [Bacteroidaceae bacterium]MBQ1675916.1 alpha/beta hydrolase [Bacteroidaceae bacterium]
MRKIKSTILAALTLIALNLSAKTDTIQVKGSVGMLSAIVQKPELQPGQKCQMVIIAHGFMGNKNEPLLKDIAENLLKKGVASIRFDFNGHGQSEGKFEHMTVLNEIEDANCIFNYVSSLDYVKSISMVGHSQGGVVTAMLSGQLKNKIKKAVLLAPAAVLRDDAIRGTIMGVMYDAANPPEEIKLLFGNLKLGGNYVKIAQTLPIYDTARQFTGQLCVIHGTYDRVVPYTYGERFAYEHKGSELHIINGADHGFSQHHNEAIKFTIDYLTK